MGIIKFIKNIFSKNKSQVSEEQTENINTTQSKNISVKEKNIIENKNTQSTENRLDNYLENEKILELKYLNNNKNTFSQENIKTADVESITINQLNTIWDIIKVKENTQAEHIIKSIPTDKWITMDEIRHNIKLNFNVEYANEKSLYPYLKTLTDINLIKVNNTGKKRTWKKNIIFIKEN